MTITVNGTNGDDVINGSWPGRASPGSSETINGLNGKDVIFGLGGNDHLNGGGGNDFLIGGAGADVLNGGDGADTADYRDSSTGLTVDLLTPSHNTGIAAGDTYISIERLRGSAFADSLFGDNNTTASNTLDGGAGADHLDGRGGIDLARYSSSTTGLTVSLLTPASNTGDAAGDTYVSIEGLWGSEFNDKLTGDNHNNVLVGAGGADVLNGKGGFDFASYQSSDTAAVKASLANPAVNTGEAAGDTYISIEGLIGTKFNDVLIGDGNDNILRGGLGADALSGGAGFDAADYRGATGATPDGAVTANLGNSTLNTGSAAGDTYTSIEGLIGSDFADTLTGDANSNFLRGGLGADKLDGGAGTDFADYAFAATAVNASLANPASNTGEAAGDTYVSIEGLIGSEFADTLTGSDGRYDFLRGGLGADHLMGGTGQDYADYFNSAAGLTVSLADPASNTGEAAGDTFSSIENIRGSSFDDTLIGDAGDNFLRGGLGADHLDGGSAGVDVADYHGAAAGLTVSLAAPASNTGEAAGDTYVSIEGLGGSNFDDMLTGDAGANVLIGRAGADVLNGGAGSDTARYDYGDVASGVTADLLKPAANTGDAAGDSYISIENLTGTDPFADKLIGDNKANALNGLGGNDTLQGNGGVDKLDGGLGTDTALYTEKTLAVAVTLHGSTYVTVTVGGVAEDTIRNIENVTGGSGNDILTGDNLANSLVGGAGNDKLDGKLGNDVLTGGAGADRFVFDTALNGSTNVDHISDFVVVDDTILLSNAVFTALAGPGTLANSAYFAGAAAHDSNDRIVYNSANGALLYDADGTGATAAIKIAVLGTGLALTHSDFLVV